MNNTTDQNLEIPFVEPRPLNVALKALVLDDELHLFEEGGRHGRRLLPEEDVDRLRHGVAELALLADRAFAAFRVLAVRQTICRNKKCHLLQAKYNQTCVNNDQSDPQLSKTNNTVYDQSLKNNPL